MSSGVSYRVSFPAPHTHLFEIIARFPASSPDVVVELPVWTPGSYLVREYSRHVQDFKALSGAGEAIGCERIDKRSFKVKSRGQPFSLSYKVYANELTVRTSHLDSTHAYFNGACLFYFTQTFRNQPHEVQIDLPTGWRASVALESKGTANTFVAPSYDALIDAPFECSFHTPIKFVAGAKQHEIVTWGDVQLDERKLTQDLTKIIDTQAKMFRGLPFERYLFFIYGTDKGRGGLEHENSTALLFPRTGFMAAKGWEDFLTLCAHEYFHSWNIKRIKPKAFKPFNYSSENYTKLLWAFEGGTSYYDNLTVRRAGLMSAGRYLTRMGETLTAYHMVPGRNKMSVAEASYLSWIKHYRPDENTNNSAISYYLKGEIVCMLLDLTIRQRTGNQKSLDDVYRYLFSEFQKSQEGIEEDGIEKAVTAVTGIEMPEFFKRSVYGTETLDWSIFSHVGLELKFRSRESQGDRGGTPPKKGSDTKPKTYLGLSFRGSSIVSSVASGSPGEAAGVYSDDELVALDGQKIDASTLLTRIEEKKPQETIVLTLFRREKLTEVKLVLGERPLDACYLSPIQNASADQKAACSYWLDSAFDDINFSDKTQQIS